MRGLVVLFILCFVLFLLITVIMVNGRIHRKEMISRCCDLEQGDPIRRVFLRRNRKCPCSSVV